MGIKVILFGTAGPVYLASSYNWEKTAKIERVTWNGSSSFKQPLPDVVRAVCSSLLLLGRQDNRQIALIALDYSC